MVQVSEKEEVSTLEDQAAEDVKTTEEVIEEQVEAYAKLEAEAEKTTAKERKAQEAEAKKKAKEQDEKAKADAAQGHDIAAAITAGLAAAKEDKSIKIVADDSVVARFTVVRNKETGEVMLRENETNVLSRVQLESIEEKEASIQGQEVEEV